MSIEGKENGTDNNSEVSSTKESIKLDATPNILWYSLSNNFKGCGPNHISVKSQPDGINVK